MRLWTDLQASGRALTGFVVIGIGWAGFSAQMPAIKAQVGVGDGLFGLIALIGAAGAVMAMWLAPTMFRLAGRWAMLVGSLVMMGGFVGTGLAYGPYALTAALFFAAAGAGVADVLANAEVSEREAATGTSLMNLNHGIFSVAYAISAFLVGLMREASWTPFEVFVVLTVGVVVISPYLRLTESDVAEAEGGSQSGLPHALVWLGGIVVLAAFLGEAASEGWSALHLERTLGGSPAQGSNGPAILATSMAVGRLSGHFLAGRLEPIRVMVLALILAAFGLALAGVAQTLAVCYVGLALGGLGVSVVGPLALGLVGQAVPRHLRLAAISRAAAVGYGAFFLGPILMGLISEVAGLRASFVVIGVLMLFVAAVLLPLWAGQMRTRGQQASA